MFSKKSMVASQILIYIIALLIFSFIMVYGYNAIKGFQGKSEQIAYINFKTDLTSVIKRVSPDYGTVKKEELFIGGEYTKVCFVQSYEKEIKATNIQAALDDPNKGDPLIADSFKSGVDKNTFLFTDSLQESFDIGKINVIKNDGSEERFLCIDLVNGKAKIKFKGMGDHTCISRWDATYMGSACE